MKSILITGGAGFIGSHFTIAVAQAYKDIKITVIDKLDYCASLNNLATLQNHEGFEFVKGDICSSDLVSYVFSSRAIDTVVHLAAQTHVDNSFGNSFSFTQNNVMGTHVLLECAKIFKVTRFVHVSTDEVYGEVGENELRKTPSSILLPTNPYAATKAAAEQLVQSYYKSFRVPIIITRGNNVYGPHQFPEKIIPKFTMLLLKDQKLPLHGNGLHHRSFLFVTDVAAALLLILQKGIIGDIYNIGTLFEISNMELSHQLCHLFGKNPEEYVMHVEDRPFNDCRYSIDSSQLYELGWKPQVEWSEGLKRTVDWYTHCDPNYWDEKEVDKTILQHHPRR
jgi:UDP-glucose 4,6-dehydratase